MLTARKAPGACHSCRLQLLTLFEHGFASPATAVPRARPHTTRLPSRNLSSRYTLLARSLSTTTRRREELRPGLPEVHTPTAAEIEIFVRQAKQTFGDTLPKDYLSKEEYTVYERLFGPPLRETRPDDLEFVPDENEEEVPKEKQRNVIIKENEDGEFEEIEFDQSLGFSVVESEPEVTIDERGEKSMLGESTDLAEEADLIAADIEETAFEQSAEATASEEARLDEFDPGSTTLQGNEEVALDQLEAADFMNDEELEIALEGIVEDIEEAPAEKSRRIEYLGRNQRERDVMARLKLDMDAAKEAAAQQEAESLATMKQNEEEEEEEEYVEEEEVEEEDEEDEPFFGGEDFRAHPHTRAGRVGSNSISVSLPNTAMVAPIEALLERTSNKHIQVAAEKAFGGKGLPFSTSTPGSKKNLEQKEIGLDAAQHKMSEIEADAYISAIMPGTYASVMNTLMETRKRLGPGWVRDLILRPGGGGPRVLDCSAGAGLIAWQEIVQAEWDIMKEEGLVYGDKPPCGKSSVLTGSVALRSRVSKFLENTSFLPRLPDYFHARSERSLDGENANEERKAYDVILAPHMLFPLREEFRRRNMGKTLWNLLEPKGGVLIVIEKGLPRGFEAVAGARSLFLEKYISSPGSEFIQNETDKPASSLERFTPKGEGMIIAPCTNHGACPMYPTPGFTFGRHDFCHFPQRFIRPQFLQRILGAKIRNHEDVKFSYVAVRRGIDSRKEFGIPSPDAAVKQAQEGYEEIDLPGSNRQQDITFNPLALPRAILSPLKRRGHVTLDVCTPGAKLERWTIPRSFSKQGYRDARKLKWGDLWALGAKTRVERQPRLGKGASAKSGQGLKGIRNGKVGKGGKKMRKAEYDIQMGDFGFEGIVRTDKRKNIIDPTEKRTKGGKKPRPQKPIGEDDL